MSVKFNKLSEQELRNLRSKVELADRCIENVELHEARKKLHYAIGLLDAHIIDCDIGGEFGECDEDASSFVEGGSTPPASTWSPRITCGIEAPTDPAKGDFWIYHPDSPSLTEWECRVRTGNQWAPIMSGKEFKEMTGSCETPASTSLDDLAGTVDELRSDFFRLRSDWGMTDSQTGLQGSYLEGLQRWQRATGDQIGQLRSDVDNLFTDHAMTREQIGEAYNEAMRVRKVEDDLAGRLDLLEASVGDFGDEIGTPEALAGTLADLGTNVQRLHSQVDVLIARVGELEMRRK